jgi:hypothetical protein
MPAISTAPDATAQSLVILGQPGIVEDLAFNRAFCPAFDLALELHQVHAEKARDGKLQCDPEIVCSDVAASTSQASAT